MLHLFAALLPSWLTRPGRNGFLPFLAGLLFLGNSLHAAPPVRAFAKPIASLAEALTPTGTLRPGVAGSFDARQFVMHMAPDGRPVFRPAGLAGTAGQGDARWQDGFGLSYLDGTSEQVMALAATGTGDIYVGGVFRQAGGVEANHIAKWNGTAWSSLGSGPNNGVDGEVYALATVGTDLYAGGACDIAGGVRANYVAKWDGTAWSPLGTGAANGVDAPVRALAAVGPTLYVGGEFARAGSRSVRHVAKWNSTGWSPLEVGPGMGDGVNGNVLALAAAANGDLYIGGNFDQAGLNTAANSVVRWTGTSWNALGSGANNGIDDISSAYNGRLRCLAVASNGDVYVGGNFARAGGVAANNIARWNGTAWSFVGGAGANGTSAPVLALAVASNGSVYAAGKFTQAGGVEANRVARWNGTAWSSLGISTSNGVGYNAQAVAVAGNTVYVGGEFGQAGALPAKYIAQWSGTNWSSLGAPQASNSVNGIIYAVAVASNGDVYVGGNFNRAGSIVANDVAKWNGTAWSSLGTGTSNGVGTGTPTSGIKDVYALAIAANGDVYVGGDFNRAGGLVANGVAKWNGSAWSSLGTGSTNGVDNIVYALATAGNGTVYVGGYFYHAGGAPANSIAQWNGTTWSALGSGVTYPAGRPGVAAALGVASNGDLYVGGGFEQAGGAAANSVAKWNGTAWSSLGVGAGNGVNHLPNFTVSDVLALAVSGTTVYVGGVFDQAGGIAANHIAKWDGTGWSSLGVGSGNGVAFDSFSFDAAAVLALAVVGTDVYAGGLFDQAGGVPAAYVAKWNGTGWSSLGTGLNNECTALALTPTRQLSAGGNFTTVGDGSKPTAYFARFNDGTVTATIPQKQLLDVSVYPNPTQGTVTVVVPAATSAAAPLTLSLIDAAGRVLFTRTAVRLAGGACQEERLTGIQPGIYQLRIQVGAQRAIRRVVVK